jgi:hypothetical protein
MPCGVRRVRHQRPVHRRQWHGPLQPSGPAHRGRSSPVPGSASAHPSWSLGPAPRRVPPHSGVVTPRASPAGILMACLPSPHRSALASFPDVLEVKVHPGGIFHKARVPRGQSRDVWIGRRYSCWLHDVMHAALRALRHVASRPLRWITDSVGSVAAVNFGIIGVPFTRDMDPREGTCNPRPEGRLTSYLLSCHRVSVHRKGGKTAPFLRDGSSISVVEVLMRSTSPKVPKSPVYSAKCLTAH